GELDVPDPGREAVRVHVGPHEHYGSDVARRPGDADVEVFVILDAHRRGFDDGPGREGTVGLEEIRRLEDLAVGYTEIRIAGRKRAITPRDEVDAVFADNEDRRVGHQENVPVESTGDRRLGELPYGAVRGVEVLKPQAVEFLVGPLAGISAARDHDRTVGERHRMMVEPGLQEIALAYPVRALLGPVDHLHGFGRAPGVRIG